MPNRGSPAIIRSYTTLEPERASRMFCSPGRSSAIIGISTSRCSRLRGRITASNPRSRHTDEDPSEAQSRRRRCESNVMTRTLLSVTIIVAVSWLPAAGQQVTVKRLDNSAITSTEIDGTVTRLMSAANVPGVGLAVFNNGEIAYLKAYGVRDKDKNLPLTEDSVMAAASFTKVAFAYLVMQLVERRVLDLDKPAYQYLPKPLPEYPAYKDLADDLRYKQITPRMLLSHTSGFPNLRQLSKDQKLKINF